MLQTQGSLGRILTISTLLGLAALTLYPFFAPVLLGFLIALILFPLERWSEKTLGLRRAWGALLLTIFVVVVGLIPLIFLVIAVAQEASSFFAQLKADEILESAQSMFDYLPIPKEYVEENLKGLVALMGSVATKGATQFLGSLPSFALDLALFIIALYYGLADGLSFVQFLRDLLPLSSREFSVLAETTEKIVRGVVAGGLAASLVQSLIIGIAYTLFQIPGALLFGTLTAILSFVPALGSGPTGLGGVLYLWFHGHSWAAVGMGIAWAIAGTSDNVIRPWMLSGETEIHPLVSLVSALGGLAIFGYAGLFLGPLFVALGIATVELRRESAV